MKLSPPAARRKRDPMIALIDAVFIMLIFFLVAGQLSRPLDSDLTLVSTADLATVPPPDALVLDAEGRLSFRGEPIADDALAVTIALADAAERDSDRVRIVPDRAVPATRLVEIATALTAAGAGTVAIVTEAGLQ